MVKALMVASARMEEYAIKTAYSMIKNRCRGNSDLLNVFEEALNKRISTVH
jgi:hypothetical protein